MASKVVDLERKRANFRKMERKYRRHKITELGEIIGMLSPIKIGAIDEIFSMPEDHQDYYMPYPGYELKTLTNKGPGFDYHELDRITLDLFKINNLLLLYRLLKDLFGPADVITAYSKIKADATVSLIPLEWGFTFEPPNEMSELFYIEIQKRTFCSQPYMIVWIKNDHNFSEIEKRKVADFALGFTKDLDEHLSQNKSLFNEKHCKEESQFLVIINIFAEKYEAGNILLNHAKKYDTTKDYKKLKIGEKVGIHETGTFYLGAITYYLMALEGFSNLLLELLLKPEFRDRDYHRITFKADLDLKLLSIPLYCFGFDKQGLTNRSAAYKKLLAIREFRNQTFHNRFTKTEDHKIYLFEEDNYSFYYEPMIDKPLSSMEKLLPRSEFVRKKHAEFIKTAVDEIVNAVIDGMTEDYKTWAIKWLHNPAVPMKTTEDGHWQPALDQEIE